MSILDEYREASPEFVAFVLKEFPNAGWDDWPKLWNLYMMRGREK